MISGKRVIAIIPARGGSKRLPRKNVLPLGGKPLIGWTIDAARDSKYIDDVFVSTDNQEIADISAQFGVVVPELRPSYLSTDVATTQSVVFYTIEKYGNNADIVIILQPTSPLRSAKHIDEALELFVHKEAFSVVSLTPCEHPPLWANTLPENGSLGYFLSHEANKRSQELGQFYRLNGAIFIYDIVKLISCGHMSYRNDSYAYKMGNEFSVDIDSALDFEFTKFIMKDK